MAPVALSITESPMQTDDGVAASVSAGTPELTITVMLAVVMQFAGLIAVNEYTVLVVGATTIEFVVAPVLHE